MSVRLTRGIVVIAIAVILAGCGISSQRDAEKIEHRDVPFHLLEEPPSTGIAPVSRSTAPR